MLIMKMKTIASLSRNMQSLFYLIDRFREYERKGQKVRAVLIANPEKILSNYLGIVTIWDLPRSVRK